MMTLTWVKLPSTLAGVEERIAQAIPPLQHFMGSPSCLKKQNHTGSLRDYVREFISLLHNVKDMSDANKLFNFLSILQNLAQIEVRMQGAKDLLSTIVTTETLMDL